MALMGVREYGRHRGVSHVAVLKAIRTGRIRQTSGGLINSDEADRDWDRNTHPAPRAPRAVPVATIDNAGFARARTVRAHYEARLAKLEFEQRAAKLLDASEVKVVSHRIGGVFKEYVLRIPDAVVGQLRAYIREHGTAPGEHEVHAILTSEIRSALEAFADEMTAGAG